MNYQQLITLKTKAQILIQLAQNDAPNYRAASSLNRCANCTFLERGTDCNRYSFVAEADYVCDSWAGRDPDVGELRALLEKAGARHSRGDNRMLQEIHDASVKLGAMCEGKE